LALRLNDASEHGEPATLSWRQLHSVPEFCGGTHRREQAVVLAVCR
jgi:hypothetical protein